MADRDLARLGFALAHDQHVGNLLQLRLADLESDLLATLVDLGAQAGGSQRRGDFAGVRVLIVGDRQDGGLHRCQPQRERPGVVLDQDAEEALHGAPQGAVDHHGLVGAPVRPDVLQPEAPRQIEVELHGGQLPRPADRVHELDIDLRSVEGRFVRHHLGFDAALAQGLEEAVLGQLPFFGSAGVLAARPAVPSGQLDRELGETENSQDFLREVNATDHFGFDLVRRAKDVGVVLREPAHAQEPVHHARPFVPVDGAEFGQSHGQVPIAPQLVLVDQDVERAVHRLELVQRIVQFHGLEHVVLVELGVP